MTAPPTGSTSNHLAIGQFYHICVDNRRPYHVYGGLQDNGSWGGPSRTLRKAAARRTKTGCSSAAATASSASVDPNDPDIVYSEARTAAWCGATSRTGASNFGRPAGASGHRPYRFNWNTPFILSQPQLGHLLRRRQLRLPLGQARRRPEADLAGDHAHEARHGDGPGGVAAQSRTCSGSAPTTALCG